MRHSALRDNSRGAAHQPRELVSATLHELPDDVALLRSVRSGHHPIETRPEGSGTLLSPRRCLAATFGSGFAACLLSEKVGLTRADASTVQTTSSCAHAQDGFDVERSGVLAKILVALTDSIHCHAVG